MSKNNYLKIVWAAFNYGNFGIKFWVHFIGSLFEIRHHGLFLQFWQMAIQGKGWQLARYNIADV